MAQPAALLPLMASLTSLRFDGPAGQMAAMRHLGPGAEYRK
jgi:hypothetical protein